MRQASRFIIAAVFLLGTTQAIAQTPRFEATAQVGPSLGWMRGNRTIVDSDALWGPTAGLTLQYELSRSLGLRIGMGYQQKGTRINATFTDNQGAVLGESAVRSTLDYLMVPLMLRASFGDKPRISVGAGPYAGYLLRAQQVFVASGFDGATNDNTEDMEPWDVGITAGVGASWPLGEVLWLNTELRYDKGLTNISALPVVDDGSIRTNAVCLLVGCSYRFGSSL